MKFFTRLLPLYLIVLSSSVLRAQEIPKYYYVVIGGFAVESNAQKFAGYVRANRYNAAYDLNSERKLSYVYVLKTLQKDEAYAQTRQLQAESEFKDAWVFFGTLERDKIVPVPVPVVKEEVQEPAVADTTQVVAAA